MSLNRFATRAAQVVTSTAAPITAFNKPELKKIIDTMKGFGYRLQTKGDEDEVYGVDYQAILIFVDKLDSALILNTKSLDGVVFDTKLSVDPGFRDTFFTDGVTDFTTKKGVDKFLESKEVFCENLSKFTDAVEFLSQYVGRAKAPTK